MPAPPSALVLPRPASGQDVKPAPRRDTEADAAPHAPDLSASEEAKAEERAPIGANVVHEVIRKAGEDELSRPPSALAWSGLAAGLSMGFSLVSEGLIRAHLPDAEWRPLLAKFGYSIGFLIVILGRQQLFTENTLTPIIPLLSRRDRETLVKVARLWTVVLASNLLGALGFAYLISHKAVFPPPIKATFIEVVQDSVRAGFATTLLRGVFAGWLIALMVWVLPGADSARVSIIIIITFIVGLGGFSHIIAGSVDVFYLVVSGAAPWADYVRWMIPTLLGNILGGVSLVAVLNHAQVVAGKTHHE